jgi:hypothetical protein
MAFRATRIVVASQKWGEKTLHDVYFKKAKAEVSREEVQARLAVLCLNQAFGCKEGSSSEHPKAGKPMGCTLAACRGM